MQTVKWKNNGKLKLAIIVGTRPEIIRLSVIIKKCRRYFDTIQTLPYIHGDPFDRLIMAVAIDNNLDLLTDDENIQKYDKVNVVWK